MPLGHGGRSYRVIEEGLLGAKVYSDPIRLGELGQTHFHIELPGQACDALLPSVFPTLLAELRGNDVRFNVKRLDLAFDDVPFSPREFLEALQADEVVSLAKRRTIRVEQSPYQVSEDGNRTGTMTVYLGANSSERMVRVYDKRGPVRLEFQMRDKRAHAVAMDVFALDYPEWEAKAKGHLRQFLDFCNVDWWQLFVKSVVRENLKISSARAVTFGGMERWLDKQVSVAMSVWFDVRGKEAIEAFQGNAEKSTEARQVKIFSSPAARRVGTVVHRMEKTK